MASDSGSSFIKRNRPPRVQIAYADPFDSTQNVELPFVMGIMSDLSGNNPGVEKPAVEERSFEDVTKDTLDDYMESIQPGMTFMVDNKLDPDSGEKMGVNLQFRKMDDLDPAAIAQQVPALKKLLDARQQLANLAKYMSSKPQAQGEIKKLLEDPELLATLAAKVKDEEPEDGGDDKEE